MSECNLAFGAVINGKEVPNSIRVHGSLYIYGANDQIIIKEAEPQGINDRVLVLDIEIIGSGDPKKGVCKTIHWEKEVQGQQYDQVTIRIEDLEPETIQVKHFG